MSSLLEKSLSSKVTKLPLTCFNSCQSLIAPSVVCPDFFPFLVLARAVGTGKGKGADNPRSVNPIPTGGRLCPPHNFSPTPPPRISRPSFGLAGFYSSSATTFSACVLLLFDFPLSLFWDIYKHRFHKNWEIF